MLVLCLEEGITNIGAEMQYGAPTAKQCERIVEPTLRKLIATCPADVRPRKTKHGWKFPNGSTLAICGVDKDKGEGLRGTNSHLSILDEAGFMRELEYIVDEVCRPQAMNTGGKLILVSTPPKSPSHPFIHVYLRDAIENNYHYKATYKDNPLCNDRWLEEAIKRYCTPSYPDGFSNPKWKREFEADWEIIDPSRRIIKEFIPHVHEEFFDDYVEPEVYQPYVGIDLGFTAHTAVVFGWYDFRKATLVLKRELVMQGCTVKEIADGIKIIEEEMWGNRPPHLPPLPTVRRIGESADPMINASLAIDYGVDVEPVSKNTQDVMINALNENMHERIRVDPEGCPMTTFQLKTGIWDDTLKKYVRTADHSNLDCIDAVKYLNLEVRWMEDPRSEINVPGIFISPHKRRKQLPLDGIGPKFT